MWQLLLLAAVGAGTGYLARCKKHKKTEDAKHVFSKQREENSPEPSPLKKEYIWDPSEAADVGGEFQPQQGGLWFSYGVGIGVMLMTSTSNSQMASLSLLLNQTADLVHELKRQLDAEKEYLQFKEMQEGGFHLEIPAFQEEKLRTDANCLVNKGSCFVGIPHEENVSATRSVITDECAHQFAGMAEFDEEFETEQDYSQNLTNHRRNISGLSESSIALVEGELCANGLPGQYSSSGNKTPVAQIENSHMDNCGVSPYELDRHLRDLLLKQQEEKISEREMQLKSMEAKLHAKEKELQQWKDHVRNLAEHSFGATSGENSSSLLTQDMLMTEDKNLMHTPDTFVKSFVTSAQEGISQLPWSSINHYTGGPFDSTADSPEQLEYRGTNCAGLTNLAHVEGMKPTRWACNSRDSTDKSYMDFLNALADDGSTACQGEDISQQCINYRFDETFDKASEASSCCTVSDHA